MANLKTLLCRTCYYSGVDLEPIALFDPETIALPLYASSFLPINNESPFPPRDPDSFDVEWYFMRCPLCGGNPVGVPEASEEELLDLEYLEVLTTDGPFTVSSERYKTKRAILFRRFEPFPVAVEIKNESKPKKAGRPPGSKNKPKKWKTRKRKK